MNLKYDKVNVTASCQPIFYFLFLNTKIFLNGEYVWENYGDFG